MKSPRGRDIRPTDDMTKERIFNIISPLKRESVVLDCFAGTGAIGIEFLSRGAGFAYFIELSREGTSLIKENLQHTKFLDQADVRNQDISQTIRYFKKNKIKIDYFYLDPPYADFDLLRNTLKELDDMSILNEDSLIIVESDTNFDDLGDYENIYIADRRDYKKRRSIIFYKVGVQDDSTISG
ncbi:MAG: 16S rRNA (guanine(966)-N(2))-methyltransferase RsmD [Tissierellia bacterium]|nr:16S rRNA (guanine(966)-N(2))-methyltransferase RsmD [Tissierellia bacterium]